MSVCHASDQFMHGGIGTRNFHYLAPALCAVTYADQRRRQLQGTVQKVDQRSVGLVIDGRRGDPDLECVAVQSGDCAYPRIGLHMNVERDTSGVRIEAAPRPANPYHVRGVAARIPSGALMR